MYRQQLEQGDKSLITKDLDINNANESLGIDEVSSDMV